MKKIIAFFKQTFCFHRFELKRTKYSADSRYINPNIHYRCYKCGMLMYPSNNLWPDWKAYDLDYDLKSKIN